MLIRRTLLNTIGIMGAMGIVPETFGAMKKEVIN
jgi:hypothetical protein